jgi:hypothetical protein
MPLTRPGRQPIHEQIMVAEHLHQRVLDELARAPARQQRAPLILPGARDRLASGNRLLVTTLSVLQKITHRKSPRPIFARNEIPG